MELNKLNAKKANTGEELVIRHPVTGEATDIVITLLGVDSAQYQAELNKLSDRRLKQLQKRKNKNLSTSELRDENVRLYAAITVKWKGVQIDKVEVQCNKDTAMNLYKEYPWIFEQVEDFVEDRSNFL